MKHAISAAPLPTVTAEMLGINLSTLPPLLDDKGVWERIAPIGRTTLYTLTSAGEIESVSVGAPGRRGKRMWITASLVAWLIRRASATKRPAMGAKKAAREAAAAV